MTLKILCLRSEDGEVRRIQTDVQLNQVFYCSRLWWTRALVAVEPRRPPTTNVGIETAFRRDQHQLFQKSKHPLRSEVSNCWCDQTHVNSELHWSACLASRISTKKEPFRGQSSWRRSIWTCRTLVDRQMQILHQGIIWSPWRSNNKYKCISWIDQWEKRSDFTSRLSLIKILFTNTGKPRWQLLRRFTWRLRRVGKSLPYLTKPWCETL